MPKKKSSRIPTEFTKQVTGAYIRPENWEYLKSLKPMFKTVSAALDAIISKDRGVPPVLGSWKTETDKETIATSEPKGSLAQMAERPQLVPPTPAAKPGEKPIPFTPGSGPGSPGYRDPVV